MIILTLLFKGIRSFHVFVWCIKLFVWYVDDTLLIFRNKEEAIKFLEYLNGLHPNIKFTMESEIDNKLPFLDLLLIRETNRLSISVYRKPTYSGVFTNYTSFIPHHFKLGLLKTLVNRAYQICSNWILFDIEINKIRNMLSMNGYTSDFVNTVVRNFFNKVFNIDHNIFSSFNTWA